MPPPKKKKQTNKQTNKQQQQQLQAPYRGGWPQASARGDHVGSPANVLLNSSPVMTFMFSRAYARGRGVCNFFYLQRPLSSSHRGH